MWLSSSVNGWFVLTKEGSVKRGDEHRRQVRDRGDKTLKTRPGTRVPVCPLGQSSPVGEENKLHAGHDVCVVRRTTTSFLPPRVVIAASTR